MADYQKVNDDDFDYENYDHETTVMVAAAEKDCEEKEKVFADHKTLTRNAKAEYETSVINLRSLIKQRQQERGPGRRQGEFNWDKARQEEAQAPKKDEDEWKAWPISILWQHGLRGRITDCILAEGINTIGELSAWLEPNAAGYAKKLTDIDGIGPAKAEQIEEALSKLWAWRDQQNGNVSATGTGSESAGNVGTSDEAADSESGEIPITVPADDDFEEEEDFDEGLDEEDE